MGLDKVRHTPCGFCFVVYYTRADTEDCVKYINGMALDERLIRVDFDWGFRDGRQFGRGKSGGQVRCLMCCECKASTASHTHGVQALLQWQVAVTR